MSDDAFTELCRVAASGDVDPALAGQYRTALSSLFGVATVDTLIARMTSILASGEAVVPAVRRDIFGDAALRPAANQLVLLLFAGATWDDPSSVWSFASAESYFGALLWDRIGAHVPALSGGYFGHWRYPPEM